MSNDNNEKLFSQQEVLEMTSKSLGIKEQDLADLAEGKDLTTNSAMSSFLKWQNGDRTFVSLYVPMP